MSGLEKSAFERLFKSEFRGLVFFAIKYVKDIDIAKEIVQDSFVAIWEKRDSIDLSKSLKSYITTSVYNRCLNYLRDNKKYDRQLLGFEGIAEQEHTETDPVIERELHQAIQQAISELPEKSRIIFKLSRYQHMKYTEIAEELGISVKTVENHMSKALNHLRIRLAVFLSVVIAMLIFVLQ